MKRWVYFMLLVLGLSILAGCAKQETDWREFFKVAPGVVSEVKREYEPQVDVFIPLKDQYANSKHANALKTLNDYKDENYKQDWCYNCHSAEYRLAPNNAKPNPKQLSTSITCIVCHELDTTDYKLRTTPMETCTDCHNAFYPVTAGQAVAHPQKEMFSGQGALEVKDRPSTKFNAGLTCIECHMPNQSHTFVALTPAKALEQKIGSTCMMCHTKYTLNEFAEKVSDLQNEIEQDITSLKKELEAVNLEIEAGKKNGKDMEAVQKLYNVAFTNVSFVEADGSKGIHNFEYANDILQVASKKISEAKQLLK